MAAQNTDDNKIAFEEEKRNLAEVEKRINAIITREEAIYQRSHIDTLSWVTYDNEDRKNKADQIKEEQKIVRIIDNYRSYLPSPYFGRFDMMRSDGEEFTFFIGKNGLSEGPRIIILDWRTPMGNTFYKKSDSHFIVEGSEYDLVLRRAVDIQNATLISVSTEYDRMDLTLDGDVIDEFLISVLKDKRRNYKLTDIIRTIQQNQNTYIRLPKDESFVIQGCAGSGKTMILLHRLSYIAYNYAGEDFSRYYILTPNRNFNLHVDDLSKSLGLDRIKRITVEDCYLELLNSRLPSSIRTSSRNAQYTMNLSERGIKLESEKNLNPGLLKELYSDMLYDEIVHGYAQQSSKATAELNELGVIETLKKTNRIVKPFYTLNSKSCAALNEQLNDAIAKHTVSNRRLRAKEKELKEAQDELLRFQSDLDDKEATLYREKKNLADVCETRLKEFESTVSAVNERIRRQNNTVEALLREKSEVSAKLEAGIPSALIKDLQNPARVYESLTSSTDEPLTKIRSACESEFAAISDLHVQLSGLAVYNFGRRARIRASIEAAEQALAEKVTEALMDYHISNEDSAQLKNRLSELDKQLEEASVDIAVAQDEKRVSMSFMNAYRICLGYLRRDGYTDLENLLSPDDKSILQHDCELYISTMQGRAKTRKALPGARDHVSRLNREIGEIRKSVLSEEDYEVLVKSQEIIKRFDIQKLLGALELRIRNLYEQFGQNYDSSVTYRYQMYLRLLLCSVYYGPSTGAGYHISIDEAQDLAPTEFKMLKAVLGSKTVFNLYGDVNQAVYEYKGIDDWGDISDCIGNNVYVMNENYRNTLQITDYCNKVFGAEITAIGLNGEEVHTLSFNEAIKKIQQIHDSSPEMRTAILYKRGVSREEQIKAKLPRDCSFDSVDPQKISVIPVDEAKGLEFDAVVVIDCDMNINEQYVSYTRALDNLIITRIPI